MTTDNQQEQPTQTSTQTDATSATTPSENTNNTNNSSSADIKDNTDSSEAPAATPESTNSVTPSTAAQTAPQQSSTEASLASPAVTSQGADAKLPSTEDQSQNKVVQTEENDKSSNEQSTPNADYFPAQTQNSLETVAGNPAAALVGQQAPGFDDNSLYDPTIVKKTDIPVAADMISNPLGKVTESSITYHQQRQALFSSSSVKLNQVNQK